MQASEDGDEVKEGMMKGCTIHFDSPFGESPPLPPLAPPPPHEQEQDTEEEPARTEVCGRGWESVDGDNNEVMEACEACGAAREDDESLVDLPEARTDDAEARVRRLAGGESGHGPGPMCGAHTSGGLRSKESRTMGDKNEEAMRACGGGGGKW